MCVWGGGGGGVDGEISKGGNMLPPHDIYMFAVMIIKLMYSELPLIYEHHAG